MIVTIVTTILLLLNVVNNTIVKLAVLVPSVSVIDPFERCGGGTKVARVGLDMSCCDFGDGLRCCDRGSNFSMRRITANLSNYILTCADCGNNRARIALRYSSCKGVGGVRVSTLESPSASCNRSTLSVTRGTYRVLNVCGCRSCARVNTRASCCNSCRICDRTGRRCMGMTVAPSNRWDRLGFWGVDGFTRYLGGSLYF